MKKGQSRQGQVKKRVEDSAWRVWKMTVLGWVHGGRKSVKVARAGKQLGTRLERLAKKCRLDWDVLGASSNCGRVD